MKFSSSDQMKTIQMKIVHAIYRSIEHRERERGRETHKFSFSTMAKGVFSTNYIDQGLSMMDTSWSAPFFFFFFFLLFDSILVLIDPIGKEETARVISLPIR